jgi:transcriptional repressor NrdR
MRCPRCEFEEDRVVDSRSVSDGKGVRRRRECVDCGHRYTTYEYVDAVALLVVKRDGRREPYQREKLRRGILIACQKQSLPAETIELVIDRIEASLQRRGGEELATRSIGRMVMEELRSLDPVAYVRFASVYRRFDSVSEFVDIVKGIDTSPLEDEQKPSPE